MLPTNTTNIFELTRVLESYEDYVVGTAVNMANHAATRRDKAEREEALREAGKWIETRVLALDAMKHAFGDFVMNTPELLAQMYNTDNRFLECVEEWPEELPTMEETFGLYPDEEEI